MPLFTGQRDISLFRQLNQELINKIIRTEILFYKLIMDESDTNVYGEGINKTYYAGVKIPCIITKRIMIQFAEKLQRQKFVRVENKKRLEKLPVLKMLKWVRLQI